MKNTIAKTIGSMAILLLGTLAAVAQNHDLKIQYSAAEELLVNGTAIKAKTKIDDVEKLLGKASDTKDYPNGETSYFFREYGVVFNSLDGKVNGVGINFNWDGDEKFPEKSYTGQLFIGESEIKKDSKSEDFANNSAVEFTCPFPLMCASKNREAKVSCMSAFEEEGITQVVFILK